MRPNFHHLEKYRLQKLGLESPPFSRFGAFWIQRGTVAVRIVAHDGTETGDMPDQMQGWEHVSVSCSTHKGTQLPTWDQMSMVKDLFWDESECVVEYHPPRADYVNQHPHTLHLWRHVTLPFPRPPSLLVGIKISPVLGR